MKQNPLLNPLQVEAIENWDGKTNLTISAAAGGSVGYQSFEREQEERYEATEYWCAMQKLDDLNVPRKERITEKEYSIVGRIMWLANTKKSVIPKNIKVATPKVLKSKS